MDDFNNYFGEVYLNNTSLNTANSYFYIISTITFLISLIFLILFILKKLKTTKTLKLLTDDELEKLEREIADDKTIHYEKYHLILTDHYIISFNHGFNLLKIADLIWIYENRIKQYGITTAKNLYVMNKEGKTSNIISTDGISKKANQALKDIITKISDKNPKILIGFSKKNQEEINEILKNS